MCREAASAMEGQRGQPAAKVPNGRGYRPHMAQTNGMADSTTARHASPSPQESDYDVVVIGSGLG